MPKRDVAIQIVSPTEGLHVDLSPSIITPRSSPNLRDCNGYFGMIQKDYGTTLFATGTGASLTVPANLIYEAAFLNNSVLEAFTHTGMYKYTSGLDSFVTDGQVYSGTFTDHWSACIHNNVLIYANGIDLIQSKAAYNSTGTAMGGVAASSLKAWSVVSFKDHLNLYHTVEGGNETGKRIRWSKVGALTFSASDWTTGVASFIDLQDMDGEIQAAEKLGNGAVAIYADNSIFMQEWVGGTDVYRFTKMFTGIGIPCRRGIVANDSVHYVFTRNNIYEYWGGRDLKPIGDAIKPELISVANQSAFAYAFLQYVESDNELRVYLPTGTSTQPDTCYICKISDNYAWFKDKRTYTAQGKTNRPGGLTIGQLVGNIGAQNWRFGDKITRAGSNVELLCDTSGSVSKMDKTVYSIVQAGTSTAQSFIFDTKDLSSINDIDPIVRSKYNLSEYMDNKTRWLELKVEAKGEGSLHTQYSIDGGYNFSTFNESPKTLVSTWSMHTFDVDIASEKFMVRFTNTATNEAVHIQYIKVSFVPGSEIS